MKKVLFDTAVLTLPSFRNFLERSARRPVEENISAAAAGISFFNAVHYVRKVAYLRL